MLVYVTLVLVVVGETRSNPPIASPPQGPIQGFLRDNQDGDPVTAFLGIPYAIPPLGDLRFRRPQPHPRWTDTLIATEYGDACPQPYEMLRDMAPDDEYYEKYIANQTYSEDCLDLNVFYPDVFTERDVEERLAVMMWIHGGGFNVGSAFLSTEGDLLSRATRVIVVTIHYRLGSFGFFATEGPDYSNGGLYDIRLALQWINHNIEAFGGDPNAVTIFGESAGAFAVSAFMISPLTEGLFHAAIGQSGSVSDMGPAPQAIIAEASMALIDRAGCSSDDIDTAIQIQIQIINL